jgi:hypothetical protein
MKFGRIPSKHDSRTLRFADYLSQPESLAKPPASMNWYSAVKAFPMYGNDSLSDCTIAALAHAQNAWTTYATGTEGGPTLSEVESAYYALSPNDTGADMLSTLKYFTRHGIGGQKIAAYCAIDPKNLVQAQMAIQLFGGVYFGLNLPAAIVNAPDMLTIPWNVATCGAVGDPSNGHAIHLAGYRNTDYLFFDAITWAHRIDMSGTAYTDWGDECYAIVSQQWIEATGVSPSGFNLVQLLADRAAIANSSPSADGRLLLE